MSDLAEYTPPKVWTWNKPSGGRFENINRPTSGATHEKELPVGRHPLQLYSLGTPNGVKVTVMLEELLALGHTGAEYDAWLIKINDGDQFGSGFVAINPNSKIPALLDRSGPKPIRVFESGAILVYLAEKFGAFLPTEPGLRAEMPVVAVLADGQHAVRRRRVRALLRLCPGQDRICHRPVHDGDEAIARRAGQAAGGQRVSRGRCVHDRRHGGMALVWRSGEVRAVRGDRVPGGARIQERRCGGPTRSTPGRRCSAGGWSIASRVSRPVSCTSGMTPAISRLRRRTRWRLGIEASRRARCAPLGVG